MAKRVASIIEKNCVAASSQINQISPYADIIELRFDYWLELNLTEIAILREQITLPVIFTLRTQAQGGYCSLSETERLDFIRQLATLAPDYVDLEYNVAAEFISELKRDFPKIQIIGSYHDFNSTPDSLAALWQAIYQPLFHIFKIATFAHSICDSLRLMLFTQEYSQHHRLITMAMGEYGQVSRITGKIVGSLFTYGSVDTNTSAAPGQLSLAELTDIYRVQTLNSQTQIYALLGNPISQSPGHIVHNQMFALLQKNAVYVKLRVAQEDLKTAVSLLRQLPFAGFSVTIPHKEQIVQELDVLSEEAQIIHVVNTIKRQNNQYQGYNTDGSGAADVLATKFSLAKRRILILGAGGSAKAIAYALLEHDAAITMCNRNRARAETFTAQYGGVTIDFPSLFAMSSLDFDVMVNTLPGEAFAELCQNWQIPPAKGPESIAMDIVLKPLDTLFLQKAKHAGWSCISGDALFAAQGLRQLEIWFDLVDSSHADLSKSLRAILIAHKL